MLPASEFRTQENKPAEFTLTEAKFINAQCPSLSLSNNSLSLFMEQLSCSVVLEFRIFVTLVNSMVAEV